MNSRDRRNQERHLTALPHALLVLKFYREGVKVVTLARMEGVTTSRVYAMIATARRSLLPGPGHLNRLSRPSHTDAPLAEIVAKG